VAVDFLAFVRGQERFETVEDLKTQMRHDVDTCRELTTPR